MKNKNCDLLKYARSTSSERIIRFALRYDEIVQSAGMLPEDMPPEVVELMKKAEKIADALDTLIEQYHKNGGK
ncbi:hypothetical protein ACXWTF_12565 [Thiomicrolovo sp. ZZH C-3]